ncbi:hypothetical protein DMUE_0016 [Dictyocoela muelleri]|nr:hypothetical protein DMUE_0016 [Dictyocoela muelleri]
MRRKIGRSILVESPSRTVSAIRTRNISVVVIMTREKIIDFKISTSPYNSKSMCGFITDFGTRINECTFQNCQLILDNATIHRTSNFIHTCAENNIMVKFLPPYSPLFNPIRMLSENGKAQYEQQI